MTSIVKIAGWVFAYLFLILAPLFVLLIGEVPTGSGFLWDFSMALGFTAMAMLGVQFFLTARFRRVTAPFGIDIIYYFHRYLAILLLVLIFSHYLIIRLTEPEALMQLNPLVAPWYMTAGRLALLVFVVMIVTSLWRKALQIHYDEWRILHIVLAVTGFLLALMHIQGVGYYINAPVKQALWTIYIIFWLWLIIYVRIIKPWRLLSRPYRVTRIQRACCNSWSLSLQAEGHSGIRFKPGQFVWLTLRSTPFQIKEHPFSISSSAMKTEQLELTIKELGDFTRTIGTTRVGDIAYIDGPYGVFSVDQYPDAEGFVFIAGGIGVAPIISMLRTLADRKDSRPLTFIYANNHEDEIIFKDELEALKCCLNLNVVHILRDASNSWMGETGYVTESLLKKILPEKRDGFQYFLCGPKGMSRSVQINLYRTGVSRSCIHFELFDMV